MNARRQLGRISAIPAGQLPHIRTGDTFTANGYTWLAVRCVEQLEFTASLYGPPSLSATETHRVWAMPYHSGRKALPGHRNVILYRQVCACRAAGLVVPEDGRDPHVAVGSEGTDTTLVLKPGTGVITCENCNERYYSRTIRTDTFR